MTISGLQARLAARTCPRADKRERPPAASTADWNRRRSLARSSELIEFQQLGSVSHLAQLAPTFSLPACSQGANFLTISVSEGPECGRQADAFAFALRCNLQRSISMWAT